MSETDRNGDPIVSAILDIIDDKRSRYLVAQAIAEWHKKQLALQPIQNENEVMCPDCGGTGIIAKGEKR